MKSTIIYSAICAAVLSVASVANAGYYGNESTGWKGGSTPHYKHGGSEASKHQRAAYKYKWKKKQNKWHQKRSKWQKKRSKWNKKHNKWGKPKFGYKSNHRVSKPYKPHKPYGWVKKGRKY